MTNLKPEVDKLLLLLEVLTDTKKFSENLGQMRDALSGQESLFQENTRLLREISEKRQQADQDFTEASNIRKEYTDRLASLKNIEAQLNQRDLELVFQKNQLVKREAEFQSISDGAARALATREQNIASQERALAEQQVLVSKLKTDYELRMSRLKELTSG